MKPVLTVEGKELEVVSVSYRNEVPYLVTALDEQGFSSFYHDISFTPETYMNSTAVEMAKAFSYKHDYAELINKRIEAHEERMIELAFDYIQHDEPFSSKIEVQKEWHRLNEQVVGLYQALEIVEGNHDEGVAEQFARGVVEKSLELAKAASTNDW